MHAPVPGGFDKSHLVPGSHVSRGDHRLARLELRPRRVQEDPAPRRRCRAVRDQAVKRHTGAGESKGGANDGGSDLATVALQHRAVDLNAGLRQALLSYARSDALLQLPRQPRLLLCHPFPPAVVLAPPAVERNMNVAVQLHPVRVTRVRPGILVPGTRTEHAQDHSRLSAFSVGRPRGPAHHARPQEAGPALGGAPTITAASIHLPPLRPVRPTLGWAALSSPAWDGGVISGCRGFAAPGEEGALGADGGGRGE